MRIDDREDALQTARYLLTTKAGVDEIADALLTAHLQGIEQARNQFLDRKRDDEILTHLNGRRDFLRKQIKTQV